MKTFNSKKSGVKTSDIDSSGALDIDAGTGNLTIDSASGSITIGASLGDAQTLKLGKNAATEMVFTPHGTPSSEKISLTNTVGTATDAIKLQTVAAGGGITLDSGGDVILSADGGNVTMDDGTLTIFDFNVDDTSLTIHDDTDTGDTFSVTVAQHGATTIATVDDDGVAAHLTLDPDGQIKLTPQSWTTATPDGDYVLWADPNDGTIKKAGLTDICFLKGTKITLPNKSQKNIEDLTLADEVLTYNIDVISEIKNKEILKDIKYDKMNGRFSQSGIRNIWINPTDSYLVINDKLNITKEHIIHFKRDNMYFFQFAENLKLGDELFTDKDTYEIIESIKEVKENTNVYNFELDKDNTYFAENYLVHHYCKLCSGYSNII